MTSCSYHASFTWQSLSSCIWGWVLKCKELVLLPVDVLELLLAAPQCDDVPPPTAAAVFVEVDDDVTQFCDAFCDDVVLFAALSSSSSVSSNWKLLSVGLFAALTLARSGFGLASSSSRHSTLLSDGLMGILVTYQSRLRSNISRINWQSGCTKSPHVSHNGCTI